MKKASQLLSSILSAAEGAWSQKKKQENRLVFSQLSSTILPQAMRIKQTYGFFERELYLIKEHRKKESVKVMDACSLAERILDKIQDHEASVSPQLLSEYYAIRTLEVELKELYEEKAKGQGSYHIQLAEFDLKRKKLILVKSYMAFLKKAARKANVLYASLEETADFYPPFIDHLLENVLIIEQTNNEQKVRLTGSSS